MDSGTAREATRQDPERRVTALLITTLAVHDYVEPSIANKQ